MTVSVALLDSVSVGLRGRTARSYARLVSAVMLFAMPALGHAAEAQNATCTPQAGYTNCTAVKDTPVAGLTSAASNPVTISGSGASAGSFTIADLTGAGISLGTLTNGQLATLT